MKISSSRKHGQGLMCRVAAGVCSKGYRVAILGKKFQIGSVGVIHKEKDSVSFANCRDPLDIGSVPEIIGRGEIECAGRLSGREYRPLDLLGSYSAGADMGGLVGIYPLDLKVK